jgi:C-terminal processing protease CtpA/Prc
MADFKTYDQAVTDGDITVWAAGGDKIAKKERFDANTKFTIENQEALKQAVTIILSDNQKVLQGNLNKITALSKDISTNLIKLNKASEFFEQADAPESAKAGDIWVDTDDDTITMAITIDGSLEWMEI